MSNDVVNAPEGEGEEKTPESQSKKEWVADKISEEAAEDSLHPEEESEEADAAEEEPDGEESESGSASFLKMPSDLKSLRRLIDQKNKSIVRSLNRRAGYALEIAKVKAAEGLAIHDEAREKEVLKKVSKYNKGPLSDEALHRIFNCIMEEHRKLEAGQKDSASTAGTVDVELDHER